MATPVPACSSAARHRSARSKRRTTRARPCCGWRSISSPTGLALLLVLVLVVVYTLLGLLGPYLMGVAIDRFINGKDPVGLAYISAVMLVVYLLNNLFQAAANWVMAIVSQRSLQQLRQDLFAHLQRLPLRFFDNNPAGELMSRLTNDIDAINQAVSQNVISLVASVLSLVGIIVAMFWLNHWLALATLLVVPIMLWFTEFVAKYTRKGFRGLQKSLGGMNAIMEESISGQKVIKAFGRNDSVVEAFRVGQPGGLRGGRLRQHVCAAADAADQRAGQLLCHRAGRRWAASWRCRAGHGRHDCHLYQLRAELYPAAAPAGQHVQRHPGGAGRVRSASLRSST